MTVGDSVFIRFTKQWRMYQPGAVTDVLGWGVADLLIRRGFAERVEAPTAVVPAAQPQQPAPKSTGRKR